MVLAMAKHTTCLSVLVVEDEALWQQAFEALLRISDKLTLAGIAASYDTALQLYKETNPDIVLLDWHLSGQKDGLDLAQTLLELGHPASHLFSVTGSAEDLPMPLTFPLIPKAACAKDLLPSLERLATTPC